MGPTWTARLPKEVNRVVCMRSVLRTNLPKHFICQGIAGFHFLAFLLIQLVWPLSIFSQDSLRQASPRDNTGLEEKIREAILDRTGLEERFPINRQPDPIAFATHLGGVTELSRLDEKQRLKIAQKIIGLLSEGRFKHSEDFYRRTVALSKEWRDPLGLSDSALRALARTLDYRRGITRRNLLKIGGPVAGLVSVLLGVEAWRRWGPVTIPQALIDQGKVTDVLGLLLHDPHHPSIRSAEATRAMTDTLIQAKPDFLTKRKITILYPGSGSHVTPLEIATQLIAQDRIDEATYIFTEIDEKRLEELEGLLLALVEVGLYTDFSKSEQRFSQGKEVLFRFKSQGKPIQIRFALNRSGTRFWRTEYAKEANVIYSHDAGPGIQKFNSELLEDFYGDGINRGDLFLMIEDVRKHGLFVERIPALDIPKMEVGQMAPELLGKVSAVPHGYGHRSAMTREEDLRHPERRSHDERGNYIFSQAHLVHFDGDFLRKLSQLEHEPYKVLADLSAVAAGRALAAEYFLTRALDSQGLKQWSIDLQRGAKEIMEEALQNQPWRRAHLLLDVLSVRWSIVYLATARSPELRDAFIGWLFQESEGKWFAENLMLVIDFIPDLLGPLGGPGDFRKKWRSTVAQLLMEAVRPVPDNEFHMEPSTRDWIYLHTLKHQVELLASLLPDPKLFLQELKTDPNSAFHILREIGRFGIGRSLPHFQQALQMLPDHPTVPDSQRVPLRQAVRDALEKIRSVESIEQQKGRQPASAGLEETLEELKKRMPEWLLSVVNPGEFLESAYRAHDPALMTDRVAVLIDPELLPPEQRDPLVAGYRLWEMEGNLQGVLGWSDEVALRIDPWTQEAEEYYRTQGFRIVKLVRDEQDQRRDPIPEELMLLILSQAVSSGEEILTVHVTYYLHLRGLDDDEVRDQLTNLYA